MDARKSKRNKNSLDRNPYDRREEKIADKAFKSVSQSVKPVSKDTNKTRRKTTRSRIMGETVPSVRGVDSMKKVMKRPINSR